MATLPGNPVALKERSNNLVASAAQIQAAAEELRAFVMKGQSLAVSSLRDKTSDAALAMDDAHQRYQGTGIALQDYAVELSAAHHKADRAAQREAQAMNAVVSAEAQVTQAKRRYELLRDADVPAGNIMQAEYELRQARDQVRRNQDYSRSAAAEIEQARRDVDAAAAHAIARIDSAVKQTNDSAVDRVKQVLAALKSVLSTVKEWVTNVLRVLLDAIVTVLKAVAKILVLALLLIAALVLVAVLVSSIIGFISATVLLLLTSPLLWLLVTALLIVTVAVAALPLLIVLGGILAWRAALEHFGATPELRRFPQEELGTNEQEAYEDTLKLKTFNGLGDFIEAEGYTDRLGGDKDGVQDASTVVDIKKVVGPDGRERWIVTIPSTQDWQALAFLFGGDLSLEDSGALNDLDTNVVLKLFPELQTRYERAILTAMEKAGIDPDDPVLLVGFSQGGIMAGHLAAHRSDKYNFTGVLAYGAPIDDWDIPATSRTGESTTVISLQHKGDVVHTLDLTDPKPNTDRQRTYQLEPPDGFDEPHNNEAYRESAVELAEKDPWIQDALSDFYGTVKEEDHYLYEFSE